MLTFEAVVRLLGAIGIYAGGFLILAAFLPLITKTPEVYTVALVFGVILLVGSISLLWGAPRLAKIIRAKR